MEWSTRLKIALASAKGLSYLHEDCNPKIIHRDVKAANIIMDFKFEAKTFVADLPNGFAMSSMVTLLVLVIHVQFVPGSCQRSYALLPVTRWFSLRFFIAIRSRGGCPVADFGLAKIDSETNTHVSTRVMGTFGYLAPEYAQAESLMRSLTLVDWALPLLNRASEEGEFEGLADKKMNNEYDIEEMARMVACAAACVRHSARRRPRMSQIVRGLEGKVSLSDLNEGIRPGDSNKYSSYGESTDYDSRQYNDEMKKVRKMALGTQGYNTTGEYSNSASDYGLCPSGSSSEGQTTREMEMGKIKRTAQGNSGPSFKP
ncbi:hypothetical protein Bca4012_004821 [Brassica carinata]